jgi:hypothetical protein
VHDESPYAWRVILILRGDAVIRRLSLKQIAGLHMDSDGYRVMRLE